MSAQELIAKGSKAGTPAGTPYGSINSLTPLGLSDEPDNETACARGVRKARESLAEWYQKNSYIFKRIFLVLLGLCYAAYFSYAMYYSFGDEASIRLLWVTAAVVFFVTIAIIKSTCGEVIYDKVLEPAADKIQSKWYILRWFFYGPIIIAFVVYLVMKVALVRPYNLVSLMGIGIYVLLFYIFSYAPSKVKWQTVGWGLGLQFILALIILRTHWGFAAFEWLGERASEFLAHTDAGAKFVFGETYADHFFAFKVLPVVIFFSSAISVLYYLGAMQVVIYKIAWVMQRTMGTTAAESVNAAGNIFVGQTEAPLLIRPMIHAMTRSELHAVMTGGFATIAGSVMATYILFGVDAHHLISASVISAPAALAMAKLFYPETEESNTTVDNVAKMEASPESNVIEAASNGASAAIQLVANIAANLIAFIALLEFVNATLTWFGARVGLTPPDYPPLTFQFICSYIMWPFAFVMGVNAADCRKVAKLIGVKTVINEFVAYSDLSVLIDNTEIFKKYNGTVKYINDDIYLTDTDVWLRGGIMKQRSIVISTYALCGFANISSIGIMLGGLGAIAPDRKSDLSAIAVRAMIAGNVACFITACIAGLLYSGEY